MKSNLRFLIFGVILACIIALGFSRGAWAGPLMQGTVPGCGMSDTGSSGESLDTCYATTTFTSLPGGFTASLVDLPQGLDLPNPVSDGGGPIIDLVVTDEDGNAVEAPTLMTVCFPDPTGVSVSFRWWSTADFLKWFGVAGQPGRWVVTPVFHTGGVVCTYTWVTGIFREIY